jgi:hypothetical protein
MNARIQDSFYTTPRSVTVTLPSIAVLLIFHDCFYCFSLGKVVYL